MRKSILILVMLGVGAIVLTTAVRKVVEFCSSVEVHALAQQ